MKKNIRRAIILTLTLILVTSGVAQADPIISPIFKFSQVAARPTSVPTPVPTAEPTAVPTAEPTAEPTAVPTAEPTAVPTVEPTAVPTAEPTAVPTAEPTAVPTAEPTPVVWPELSVSIFSNLSGLAVVDEGTEMILTMEVEGAAGRAYTIQWQESTDQGETWQDIEGANAEEYRVILRPHHSTMLWRVTIDLVDAESAPAA